MSAFHVVSPDTFTVNPFTLISKDWLLITAEYDGKVNTMTASWGGLGFLWNKNVATIYVRDTRYTKEFLDHAKDFSLTVFDHQKNKEMLGYMGRISGRDENKIAKCGLTVAHVDGVPYFEEAQTVLLCRKLFCQPMTEESFCDKSIFNQWYGEGGYHSIYIGEIQQILQK